MTIEKLRWNGKLTSLQSRIRLIRSFDERTAFYREYALGADSKFGSQVGKILVGTGKGARAKLISSLHRSILYYFAKSASDWTV